MPTALAAMYGAKSTAVSPNAKDIATYGESGDRRVKSTICAPSRITAWSSAANLYALTALPEPPGLSSPRRKIFSMAARRSAR